MASGQFITSKLMRTSNDTPWGFRLQGGKEFQTPLSIVKVASGSLADQTGIQVGDIILKINGRECEQMRHKEAQEVIIAAGNYLELYLERGSMNTWRPSVTPVGDVCAKQPIYTQTSLAKSPEKCAPIGTGHNSTAKPFALQSQPALVHKQYNSPVNLYSERNIEETLNAHTQVLSSGATGINFMRPDAPVNKESAVYQMVHDEEMRKTKGISSSPDIRNNGYPVSDGSAQSGVIKHVEAPVGKPNTPTAPDASRNICSECERLIVGVFVRVNNKPLHADCFRCATCGTSLKNIGYFNVNDKLYCDIHARQVKTLMGVGGNPVYSSPAPLMDNQYTNGHATQNGFHSTSAPYPNKPEAGPPQPETNSVSYQSNVSASQNGFQNVSSPKKYSSVTPPSAPRSNYSQNRNSMYVNPSTISSETHTTGNSKFNWPPPGTGENVVTYRQNTQYQNRPKSCYSSLPSAYSVTSSTYSTTTNYNSANQVDNANVANYPKTAMYASSTQTTISSQPGLDAKPLAQTSYVPGSNPTRQWSSSGASFGKSTVSDSRSAPKRGRGLLQSQLSGGVIPFCGYCSQPIRGQYIMALNKTWCPNHFVCANALCKRSLEQNGFVEEQGRLYCETCYETHFAPTCSKCNQRIKGDCLNALDRQWHPNCFTCSYCKKPFGNSSFYLEDGHPYCEKDWNDLFTTKCVGCGYPIAAGDRWVEALNQNYHSNCFRCTVCRGNLEGQSFFAKGGRPYCKAHAR